MPKILLMVSMGILALLMGSCQFLPGLNNSQTQTPKPEKPNASPSPSEPEAQDSEVRVEPEKPKNSTVASGLIPPTNPDKRRKTIVQGRQDPFAQIPVEPEVKVDLKPREPESPTQIPAPQPPIIQPPGPPEPDLARNIVVSGIIEIGGVTQLIVKAPNERFSRYVQPGQYISNGQVLVKRIERNQSLTPIVVLEQFGIEVFKEVGEKPEEVPSEESEAATAFVPSSLRKGV